MVVRHTSYWNPGLTTLCYLSYLGIPEMRETSGAPSTVTRGQRVAWLVMDIWTWQCFAPWPPQLGWMSDREDLDRLDWWLVTSLEDFRRNVLADMMPFVMSENINRKNNNNNS